MISKAKWQKYVDRLAAIDDRAAAEMERYIDANGLTDDKALIDYAYALATKYGEASAELACEMYDLMAKTQGANVPPAVPAETATIGEVAKNVGWAKYHSPGQIPSKVGRFVRQAGADTMLQNASRDGVQWAWVPFGGETCAFCIALASRGWQDASDAVKRGRHASHIHANCDCTFAIAHNEKAKRDYDYIYDPDRYKEMYYGAEGATPAEKINALRRLRYQENREYINAQKRDAYHARKLSDNNLYRIAKQNVISENNDDIHILNYSNEKSTEIQELLSEEEKGEFKEVINLIDKENYRYDAVFKDSSRYLNALVFGNKDSYYGCTVGDQHSSTIILSKLWKNPQHAFEILTKERRHIKTDDPMSVYAHEYGHYLIDAIALKRVGYRYNQPASAELLSLFAEEKRAIYSVLENQYYYPNVQVLKDEISERGAENVKEFVAECFSQHFCGNYHSEIAEEVIKLLVQRWNDV